MVERSALPCDRASGLWPCSALVSTRYRSQADGRGGLVQAEMIHAAPHLPYFAVSSLAFGGSQGGRSARPSEIHPPQLGNSPLQSRDSPCCYPFLPWLESGSSQKRDRGAGLLIRNLDCEVMLRAPDDITWHGPEPGMPHSLWSLW